MNMNWSYVLIGALALVFLYYFINYRYYESFDSTTGQATAQQTLTDDPSCPSKTDVKPPGISQCLLNPVTTLKMCPVGCSKFANIKQCAVWAANKDKYPDFYNKYCRNKICLASFNDNNVVLPKNYTINTNCNDITVDDKNNSIIKNDNDKICSLIGGSLAAAVDEKLLTSDNRDALWKQYFLSTCNDAFRTP